MKVDLISTSYRIEAHGLRYISANLKKAGHKPRLIFLPKQLHQKIPEKMLDELASFCGDSDLLGISLMSGDYSNAKEISTYLKNKVKVPIIWGGVHPTLMPRDCLKYADFVCLGEGEDSIVELANVLNSGSDLYRHIPGIMFKGNDDNEKKIGFVDNLDKLPYPDWDLKTQFILRDNKIAKMDKEILLRFLDYKFKLLVSRGCVFDCTYCNSPMLNPQKKVHYHSVDYVISYLSLVKRNFASIRFIHFSDDSFFTLPLEYISDLCERYKKEIGLPFDIPGLNPVAFNEKKFALLVDAGLFSVRMGIQSGSERIRKLYKRKGSNKHIVDTAKKIRAISPNIDTRYDIILNNPWETNDDKIATLKLLNLLPKPFSINYYFLTFFPRTQILEKAIKDGIIKDEKEVYRRLSHRFTEDEKGKADAITKISLLSGRYTENGITIPNLFIKLIDSKFSPKFGIDHLVHLAILVHIMFILFCRYLSKAIKILALLIMKRDHSPIEDFVRYNLETRKRIKIGKAKIYLSKILAALFNIRYKEFKLGV